MEKPAPTSDTSSSISNLCKSVINIIKDSLKLTAFEFTLAGKSLALIITLSIVLLLLLATCWLCLLGMLCVALLHMGLGWEYSLLILVVINLFATVPIFLLIAKLRYYLTFPMTRKHLLNAGQNYAENSPSFNENPTN